MCSDLTIDLYFLYASHSLLCHLHHPILLSSVFSLFEANTSPIYWGIWMCLRLRDLLHLLCSCVWQAVPLPVQIEESDATRDGKIPCLRPQGCSRSWRQAQADESPSSPTPKLTVPFKMAFFVVLFLNTSSKMQNHLRDVSLAQWPKFIIQPDRL